MDISTPRHPVSPPAAGDIRLIVEDGYLRAVDSNGRKMRLQVESGVPLLGVAATLSTNLTGTNNDLVFTAITAGKGGKSITVAYVDPGEETASESVSVSGTNITVTLRSVSSVLSTAAQVKAAIEVSAAANALVSVANKAANDGTGVVTAMDVTPLATGFDATEASAGDRLYDSGDNFLYIAATDIAKTDTIGWVVVECPSL